jgi:SprT-like family
VIAWLKRRLSRDPGQLVLFEPALTCETQASGAAPSPPTVHPRAPRVVTEPSPPVASESPPAHDPNAFLELLRGHGMRGVDQLVFTRNRRTMVSLMGRVLRVHEGFAVAPVVVREAIAIFATSRNRAKRSSARDIIVTYPVPIRPPSRRPAATNPDDAAMAARLTLLHAQLNLEHFDGRLDALEIQVSRRLARRLGHYTLRSHTGGLGEIVISRRHVRRDGWPEAIETLLHEMVHQWQDETGRPVDHGAGFRAKCVAVGISPAATRMMVR